MAISIIEANNDFYAIDYDSNTEEYLFEDFATQEELDKLVEEQTGLREEAI